MPRLCCVVVLLLSVSGLFACGPGNDIRLLPLPLAQSPWPPPGAKSVTVQLFDDRRVETAAVGERRDKSAFLTRDDVAQWISRAFADELAHTGGLQVSFASSFDEARKGNPDYLISGHVEEAWLKEISSTEMIASLRVSYVLANRQKRILREARNASQSRTGLPSGTAAENLMLATLQDMIRPMAQKIAQTIQSQQ